MKYINAEGLILGRLTSHIAKLLLQGEEVIVVNAEKAIITGNKKDILNKYRVRRELVHKRKGPYYPKRPERIFKRTVRGMLPYQQPRGREALKRLKVYVGVPRGVVPKNTRFYVPKNAKKDLPTKYMELGEVSRLIGGKF